MASKKETPESREPQLLVPDMPPDTLIEIPGKGLFYNSGERWVPDEPVAPKQEPAPVEALTSLTAVPEAPAADTTKEGA